MKSKNNSYTFQISQKIFLIAKTFKIIQLSLLELFFIFGTSYGHFLHLHILNYFDIKGSSEK